MLKSRVRITSCFLWVALTMLGFYSPSPAKAEVQYGLDAIGYSIDQIPPEQSDSVYPTCGYELENNINRNFDGEPFAQCSYDYFMVHYSGYITLPQHQTIEFMIAADDGGTIDINGSTFGDWNDKGCTWYMSGSLELPSEQSLPLDGWFYENGGGTCYMLAWKIDDGYWEIVPDTAFTQEVVTTTTTSTTSTTTTTEVPQPLPTTTLVSTTTLPPLDVTTSSSSTSTVPVTTIAVPSTTLPPETTTSTSTTLPVETTTTTIPVNELLSDGIDAEEAVLIVTSAETLQKLSEEQAVEVFESLEVSELSDEEAEALVEAVQDAPEEVRAAFESEVNVFDNKFNSYVPIGSNINVGQRKVLVAASGVLFMAPVVSVSSATSSTPSDSRGKRK